MSTFYQFAISLLLSSFICLQTAHAYETALSLLSSTVVYVTMEHNDQDLIWKKLEKRIQEELDLLDLRVLVSINSTNDKPGIEQGLRDVAVSNNATAAFKVVKESEEEFLVFLFTSKQGDRHETFKEIPIHLPSDTVKNEKVEIVSLRTVEAVQAAILIEQEPTDKIQVEPPPHKRLVLTITQKSMTTSLSHTWLKRGAIAGLVSGIVVLGIGGVLHSQKLVYETDANEIADRNENKVRDTKIYDDEYKDYLEKKQISTAFRIGTIVTYAVGGTLTAVGAALELTLMYKKHGKEHATYAVKPTGIGLIVEF